MNVKIWVKVIRCTPSDGGHETWSVRYITLTDEQTDSGLCLLSLDWSIIASLLPLFPQLQQLQILCASNYTKNSFHILRDRVRQAVNNHPVVRLNYNPGLPDGRFLEPKLFNLSEEITQTSVVWTELCCFALH
ncbi:uncharacterized protein PHACADRAFT_254592 [Phanerochaete carnosa HHB-10118-sp]|uniref:Uncharacterized protein n=1 Tax=Phanerochaete carnosa (strain HHB-10118-sp) TaxID=650164 RepID=K5V3B1_PHACS|nr:uncharacterized protein PHACADRAFT_254592 [Phanerochaete carnosa HHB-10118-sp]EKM57061.1 hypothetical protein PHACADRAFT_254592 [Phanerochaete carnosa HHB-10118-sp]